MPVDSARPGYYLFGVVPRLARFRELLLGTRPLPLLVLLAPTLAALVLDLMLRAQLLAGFRLAGKAIYLSSLFVGAAFWFLPLWLAARFWPSRRRTVVAWFAFVVFPLVTLGYPGQALYYDVFHAYAGRDTVRVGLALRETVGGWLFSWGSPGRFALAVLAGLALSIAFVAAVRRVTPCTGTRPPLLAVVAFVAALGCLLFEGVDSRFLQAATPDVCLAHGVTHALLAALGGKLRARQGLAMRTPVSLAPLARARPHTANVIVVLTESVRADAMCSQPPPVCTSPFLDEVAADRVPLGRLTTQAPNTFTASTLLWTGLPANVDVRTAHTAPVLWEVARAAGYRTAYVTSQNGSFDNFSAFVQRAGIERLLTGGDLGGLEQEQLGAPDERACAEALRFVRDVGAEPFFLMLHLSNTHAPYRIDPALRPFTPDSDDPLGDPTRFRNRYKNSVRLLERTLAAFLRELRSLPAWEDTAVLVLSDHGEQFFEHGAMYHNHSLYEQELRVPGWLVAGSRALTVPERAALATFVSTRTYLADVHATVIELLGVDRDAIPYDDPAGRPLLRPRDGGDPLVLLTTSSAVWEADIAVHGATQGDRKVSGPSGGDASAYSCFDVKRHPSETTEAQEAWCRPMIDQVRAAFADGRP